MSNEGILQVPLFTILCFMWSVKEHCVAKFLPALSETFLYKNNCNFNL